MKTTGITVTAGKVTAAAMLASTLALTGCSHLNADAQASPATSPSAASTPTATTEPITITPATTTTATSGWLHTSGAKIKDSKNRDYLIKGISWFGLETPECAPHGLWEISMDDGLKQIKAMGFNTVRLPYSTECLSRPATSTINFYSNPDLKSKSPQQVMDIFVKKAKDNGLNVILDRHRISSSAQSPLWYTSQYSEARWISDWKALAKRYKKQAHVVGFDLHNEPRGKACWACGDKKTDWQAAATRAGNAIHSVNPNLLIIVEGVERQPNGTYTWWGGGLGGVAKKPVILKTKNRVVYSPHEYPASIYPHKWFSAANYPNNLPALWDKNWGFISKQKIAPVMVGEFGSKLQTKSDKQWLTKFVSYLQANNTSFVYWSYNPDSGDTGGIIKDDWRTPERTKLNALQPLLGPGIASKQTIAKPVSVNIPENSAGIMTAVWNLKSDWTGGYVAEFDVTAHKDVGNWTITWPDPSVTGVVESWGLECSVKTRVSVTCTGNDWAERIRPGQTLTVGLQVESLSAPPAPTW